MNRHNKRYLAIKALSAPDAAVYDDEYARLDAYDEIIDSYFPARIQQNRTAIHVEAPSYRAPLSFARKAGFGCIT